MPLRLSSTSASSIFISPPKAELQDSLASRLRLSWRKITSMIRTPPFMPPLTMQQLKRAGRSSSPMGYGSFQQHTPPRVWWLPRSQQ